jgi:WD40 repeat protein
MAKTQSVVISDHVAGIAMSPDGNTLATSNRNGGTRIFECRELTSQKYAIAHRPEDDAVAVFHTPVAFDPTSRFYAVGCADGRVVLRSI